jgi:hypothetical protein
LREPDDLAEFDIFILDGLAIVSHRRV